MPHESILVRKTITSAVARNMLFILLLLFAFLVGAALAFAESWQDLRQQWIDSRRTMARESAERILNDRRRVLASEEAPKLADIREFAFRGFEFYDGCQATLEALGFTLIGDFALDQATWV